MKTIFTFLSSFLVVFTLSSVAWSQSTETNEEYGITATVPDDWDVADGNDRAVFNFLHAESHSQIEVIGTRLMTADVADVFFETFHETLEGSQFEIFETEDKSIGDFSGTETIYEFDSSGVRLKIAVFQFVNDTVAWITVTYIQNDIFEEQIGAYREVIGSLSFEEVQ